MSERVSLIHRPDPLEGECLTGYLVRLARANRYPSTYWITGLAGVYQSGPYLPSEHLLSAIADLSGKSAETLRRMTLHRFASVFNGEDNANLRLEHRAVQRFVHHKSLGARFCLECAKENDPWQLLWQLRMVTTCLRHGVLLIEACPQCDSPFGLQTWWNKTCRCGKHLSQLKSVPVGSGSRASKSQDLIQTMLDNPRPENGLSEHKWFLSLDFYQKWFSDFPAGSLSLDGITTINRPHRRRKLWQPIPIDHVHFGLAVEAISRGREGFWSWCDFRQEAGAKPEPDSFGYLSSFKRLKELMDNHPQLTHYRKWFREYLATRWSGGYATRIHHLAIRHPSLVGLQEAARQIGHRSSWNVAFLIDAGRLRGRLCPIDLTGKLAGFVEQRSLDELRIRRREALGVHPAARRAGVTPMALLELYYRGAIAAERGPITDGTLASTFHPRDLEQLAIDPCLSGEMSGHSCVPSKAAGLKTALHPEVLAALQLQGLAEAVSSQGETPVTLSPAYVWEWQAARLVGLPLPAFRRWVNWGRIKPVLQVGPLRVFLLRDLERWTPLARCTVKEAALLLGMAHPQQLRRGLLSNGQLTPIAGPGVDQGAVLILNRLEVLALAGQRTRHQHQSMQLSQSAIVDASTLVSTEEAACLLGLTVGAFQRRYRDTNLIQPFRREGVYRKDYFALEDVDRLRAAIGFGRHDQSQLQGGC